MSRKIKVIIPIIILLVGFTFVFIETDYKFNTVNSNYVEQVKGFTPFEYGLTFYGEKEFTGIERNNPQIVLFIKDIASNINDDETPWCSAYVNYVHKATGYYSTGSLAARSWVNYGEESTEPRIGDIIVLWRRSINDWRGHVGFFVRYSNDRKKVLISSGNQSNMVNLQWYDSNRILTIRKSIKINEDCI